MADPDVREALIDVLRSQFAGFFDREVCAEAADAILTSGLVVPAGAGWNPIETAPHETSVLLFIPPYGGHPNGRYEAGWASGGQRYPNGYSDRWFHGEATNWMPLPLPPVQPASVKEAGE